MKAGLILLLLVGAALGIVAWNSGEPSYVPPRSDDQVPIALTAEAPPGHAVVTLDVEGMCCDGCRGTLYDAVIEIEGVRAAAIDHLIGVAEVVLPTDADLAAVEEALTFDKYVARVR